jgi:hypothetical protein
MAVNSKQYTLGSSSKISFQLQFLDVKINFHWNWNKYNYKWQRLWNFALHSPDHSSIQTQHNVSYIAHTSPCHICAQLFNGTFTSTNLYVSIMLWMILLNCIYCHLHTTLMCPFVLASEGDMFHSSHIYYTVLCIRMFTVLTFEQYSVLDIE